MAVVPSCIWVFITSALCLNGFDFGRGVNYPYFFFDFFAPIGLFGFSNKLPIMGCAYWIVGIGLSIFLFGLLYAKLKAVQRRK